jgi:hypothetical protein
VLGKAEIAVPARDEHHVIFQVLPLNLEFLHDDNVGLKDVEHGVKSAAVAPRLVAERVANAVDIPRRDAERHG